MAVNLAPSEWLPNATEDGTDWTIPLSDIAELTAAEADATAGDWRKIWFALWESMFAHWNGLDTADRPGKIVSYSKTATYLSTTDEYEITYNVRVRVTATGLEVSNES